MKKCSICPRFAASFFEKAKRLRREEVSGIMRFLDRAVHVFDRGDHIIGLVPPVTACFDKGHGSEPGFDPKIVLSSVCEVVPRVRE